MINKCENCGGKIKFSPKNKGNLCEKCGSVFPVEYNPMFNKKLFEQAIPLENDKLSDNLTNYNCKSCGASVLVNKGQLQAQCAYCGDNSLVQSKKTSLMFIDSLIPFSFDKQDALEAFKSNVSKRVFANKTIFKDITTEDISGTYVNAFVFDISTESVYSGVFSYTRTVKTSDGKTKTERIRKHVSGNFSKLYNNLTIEANSHLDQNDLISIEPFEYGSAVEFKEDFMNGYMLEYQDRAFDDCFKNAENIMTNDIKKALLRKHGCDRIESINLSTTYTDKKYNYCLLPVYFVTTIDKKKDKKYRAVMNGQTGKVGKLPLNGWKIFGLVFGICVFLVAIVLATVFLGK